MRTSWFSVVGDRVGTKQISRTAKSRACMIQASHLFPSLFIMSYESQYIRLRIQTVALVRMGFSLGLVIVPKLLKFSVPQILQP